MDEINCKSSLYPIIQSTELLNIKFKLNIYEGDKYNNNILIIIILIIHILKLIVI